MKGPQKIKKIMKTFQLIHRLCVQKKVLPDVNAILNENNDDSLPEQEDANYSYVSRNKTVKYQWISNYEVAGRRGSAAQIKSYDQIHRKLRILSHLLKKFLMKDFTFCSV